MSEMVERAAAASRKAVEDAGKFERSVSFEEMSRIVARAVIQEMMEPTEAMDFAGQKGRYQKYGGATAVWKAMITEALAT